MEDNKKKVSTPAGKDRGSFDEHSERMKEFRTAHAQPKTKGPKNLYCMKWFLIPLPPVDLDQYKLN